MPGLPKRCFEFFPPGETEKTERVKKAAPAASETGNRESRHSRRAGGGVGAKPVHHPGSTTDLAASCLSQSNRGELDRRSEGV